MSVEKSRTKFAVINMFFNFAYQIVNTLVNIIIPPLLIAKFGDSVNGLVATIRQIIGYLQLVGAGISDSTVVTLYEPITKDDKDRVSSIFNASSITFFRMGMLFSAGAVLLSIVYPFVIGKEFNYFFVLSLVLILSVAGASEFFVIGKCRSLLIADQKIYIVNITQIIGAISNLVITILFIHFDFNVLIVQLGATSVYVARLILLYLYVKKKYSYLNKSVEPDFFAISKRKAATVHQLSGLIAVGSQTIVVSIFCGLTEASIYSVYNLVITGINMMLSTVSAALLASFGSLFANQEKEKIKVFFKVYEVFFTMVVFFMYAVTYKMLLSFITIYVGSAYVNNSYALLFCVLGISTCVKTPGTTLIVAIGHFDETKNRAIIEMLICLILELILVQFFGINGVLFATIIAYSYRTIDVFFYSNKRILNGSVWGSLKVLLLNLLIFVVIHFLLRGFNVRVTGYVEWVKYAAATSMLVLAVYVPLNALMFREQFSFLFRRIFK